jgi:hypothetical protein
MRIVHFVAARGTVLAMPRCGRWGSMDSDWVDLPGGVTCPDCLVAMAAPAPPLAASPVVRLTP